MLAAALLAACGAGDHTPPKAAALADSLPSDSLVATAPGGVQVWFTLARHAKSPEGVPCVDRAMEIRRGDTRVKIPLLYTGAAPELVNDSTLRARLSNQCRPGDAYLVDLRTGRPIRERHAE
ncbi:MAG TPA: hypothetical protein VJQ44_15525 [Gemmatimonadales bacterium]|nr:hypothetical protein [Gemmatimonadales bacterium]